MCRTNVLIGTGGVAKLADFGLTAITADRGASSYTAPDDASRPERWLAPEVLEGGQGDAKADVYAFGMLLYEIFAKAVRHRFSAGRVRGGHSTWYRPEPTYLNTKPWATSDGNCAIPNTTSVSRMCPLLPVS